MVCRNKERGEKAKKELVEKTGSTKLEVLVADVSLQRDVRQLVQDFNSREDKLDGLVCNAGALASERQLTAEGVETTIATHLVFGWVNGRRRHGPGDEPV